MAIKKQAPTARILIIDDERAIRSTLREILEFENYEVEEAKDGEEALALITAKEFDLALCDVKMPKLTGIEVLERTMELGKNIQFVMISAHGDIETAVEATRKGAYDFIQKPPDLNRLLLALRNALDKSNLLIETRVLRKKISKTFDIVGESEPVKHVKTMIDRVAPSEAKVLITGPNGSGKELVAKWIHAKSHRSEGPLVEVNCAAIPSELIESELFGHEKGAFTSAVKQHIGKFEQANKGTLFLDEIGDMSLSAQAKVLRTLQDGKIARVGGDKEIKVDVRVLAATNKDLREEIKRGNFREDLYHRLSVIVITVPSLNDRRGDIPLLVDKFLDDISQEYGEPRKTMAQDAFDKLKAHDWTGNIRELRNVVERLIILSGNNAVITADDVVRYM